MADIYGESAGMPTMETLPQLGIEQEDIRRRRALAMALQQQSQQQTPMITAGGITQAPSWTNGLARLAQAYMGAKGIKEAKADEIGLVNKRQGIEQQQIADYFKPQPGVDGQAAPATYMTPQLQQKLQQAMLSRNPMLMAAAQNDIKLAQDSWTKNHPTLTDLKGAASDESLIQAAQDGSGIAGLKPKVNTQMADGVVMQMTTGPDGKPRMEAVAGNPQYGTETINGDLYQVNPLTGKKTKLDNAPKVTVTNNNNSMAGAGEKEFGKRMGNITADEVGAIRTNKTTAQQSLNTVNRLEELAKSGTFSGPTANVAKNIAAMAQTLGIPIDEKKLANTQGYEAVLAQQISKYLTAGSGVGRSLTDADREALERQYAALLLTEGGRKEVFRQLRMDADNQIKNAAEAEKRIRANPAFADAVPLFDLSPSLNEYPNSQPPAATPAAAAPMSLNDYLKKSKK